MELEQFNRHRKAVETSAGDIAYVDVGAGPETVFVHGVFLNSYLWRNVIGELRHERRCVALDLPGHGRTRAQPGHDLSLPAQADLVEEFCSALDLGQVDLVANDTGGAIAQILAARHPARLRTLTLTNCDAHDQIPPDAFKAAADAAARGELAPAMVEMFANPELARRSPLGLSYEYPERITDETIREYFSPFATLEGAREVERAVSSLHASDLMAVEPELANLNVPTLIVWGTGDVFFDVKWAYWLKNAIGGAERVVEIPGAKLFYPEERAADLLPHLRQLWAAHSRARAGA